MLHAAWLLRCCMAWCLAFVRTLPSRLPLLRCDVRAEIPSVTLCHHAACFPTSPPPSPIPVRDLSLLTPRPAALRPGSAARTLARPASSSQGRAAPCTHASQARPCTPSQTRTRTRTRTPPPLTVHLLLLAVERTSLPLAVALGAQLEERPLALHAASEQPLHLLHGGRSPPAAILI